MSKLIRKILTVPALRQQKSFVTLGDCNYSNNYYGDQVCRVHPKQA